MPANKNATPKTAAPKAAKKKPEVRKSAREVAGKTVTKKAAVKEPKKAAPARKPAKPAKPVAVKAVAKVVKKPAVKELKGVVKKPVGAKKPAVKPAKTKALAAGKAPGKAPGKRVAKPAAAGSALMESSRGTTGLPTNGVKLTGYVARQRQRLLDLRDELINSMYGVTRETLRNAPEGSEASGSGMHQGDAGSDAYDRDFALSVLAKEQDALFEVEEALKRIQRGSYGVCEISGRKIPQARLEAIPFARLTVECQAEWEKEHGQRRFRPSTEAPGFGGDREDRDELEDTDEEMVD